MKPQNHIGPLTQRIAEPVYSIVEQLTDKVPGLGGGDKLDAFLLLKGCLLACVEKAALYTVTDGWETPVGSLHPTSFNKHTQAIKDLEPDQLHRAFQPIFDNQLRRVLMTQKHKGRLVAALDFHEQQVYIKKIEKSPLARFVIGRMVDEKKIWVLRFLTCSLVLPFHHVAAVRFVGPLDSKIDTISKMVEHISSIFGIHHYLLDRGFFDHEVTGFFERSNHRFQYMMPVPRDKKIKAMLMECEPDLSTFDGEYMEAIFDRPYVLKEGTEKEVKLTLHMIVSKKFLHHLKRERELAFRHRCYHRPFTDPKMIAFTTNFEEPITAKLINRTYRRRWRIETGYRMIEDLMVKTSTTNIRMRIFWFSLACALENIWEWLRRTGKSERLYHFRKAVVYLCNLSDGEVCNMIGEEARHERDSQSFHRWASELREKSRRSPLAG
jgi:hypothetical protein